MKIKRAQTAFYLLLCALPAISCHAAKAQEAGGQISAKHKIKAIKIQEGIETIDYIEISDPPPEARPKKSPPQNRRPGNKEAAPAAAEAGEKKAEASPQEENSAPGGAPQPAPFEAAPPQQPLEEAPSANAASANAKSAGSEETESKAAEAGLQTPKNTVSETLSPPQKPGEEERGGILIPDISLPKGYSWLDDYSWFFEKRKTRHKIGLLPSYYRTQTYGSNLGLRLFFYSPESRAGEEAARPLRQGYYLGASVLSPVPSFDAFKFQIQYIESYKSGLLAEGSFLYSNYFEPYYKGGINSKESDREDLHSSRFKLNYKILRRRAGGLFYGGLGQLIFRTENPDLNKDKKERFSSEFLLNLKALLGYDSRDSWKDPKKGQFVQMAFGCAPSLGHGSSFCLGDIDARSWLTVYSWTLALRGFIGSSFFAKASYSLAYTLGGAEVLRGFSENRFRGDKVYFGQAELRRPLLSGRWREFLSGAVFAEIGETAEYSAGLFQSFRWDYGFGLRFGIPPSYKIKLRVDVGISTDPEDERRFRPAVGFLQAF